MASQEPRPDIFDRVMSLPLLRRLYPFYSAHKEALLYLFFGGVTTLIDLLSFVLFESVLSFHELLANVLAWFLAVLTAYLTNRVWVFHSEASGALAYCREILSFFASRVATLLFAEGVLFVFVTRLSLPALPVKIVSSVFVVILNYVFSKLLVFRKEKTSDGENA